jgi:dipeptidyl aminopeptidase/acylaminoacyl peptidase
MYEANPYMYHLPLFAVLPASREAIWFSQRDGWGHLYLYDLDTGLMKNSITVGQLAISDILRVDRDKREVFFLAGSAEDGHNPYWRKIYRASLDGGEQTLLTPEPADHDVAAPRPAFFDLIFNRGAAAAEPISPDGRYFIDHMSTVCEPPEVVLRESETGRVVAVLERTDVSALLAAGYRAPEEFCVKAADGVTDIWGVITLPDTEPNEMVPVVDIMYAGHQVSFAPRGWVGRELEFKTAAPSASLAALGMASVVLDGRGTPGRDKLFRQWTHGHPETARGLEDHVAAIQHLAEAYPQLDLDRVGVTGESFGGYYCVRATLLFPDFFKAAVSSVGVHVPEKMPKGTWSWHVGPDIDRTSATYQALSNLPLVDRLKGKLMLVYGDLDENATPDHTLALIDALIQAGKRFDAKVFPGQNHYHVTDYRTIVTVWDFLVEHLLGEEVPLDYVLSVGNGGLRVAGHAPSICCGASKREGPLAASCRYTVVTRSVVTRLETRPVGLQFEAGGETHRPRRRQC